MDIITEAREYLECHPLLSDGTYFAEHNNLIKALLTKLEEKERELKERWQTDTIKNKQINKLLAENERLMGVAEEASKLVNARVVTSTKNLREALASLQKEKGDV